MKLRSDGHIVNPDPVAFSCKTFVPRVRVRLTNCLLAMKRSLIFAALFLAASLTSCQCADPPPVGPVEGEEEEQAHRIQEGNAERGPLVA